LNSSPTPPEIKVAYALRPIEWVWGTAALKPSTLLYDFIAATLLLAIGAWEHDLGLLALFAAVALVMLASYIWLPWLMGRLTGTLKRATSPIELTIDAAGISAQTDRGVSLTEWGAVKTVREIGGCLAVIQFSGRYRLIPERALTAYQLEALRKYLKEDGYWHRSLLARLRAPVGGEE
jgi:hypothetical protein